MSSCSQINTYWDLCCWNVLLFCASKDQKVFGGNILDFYNMIHLKIILRFWKPISGWSMDWYQECLMNPMWPADTLLGRRFLWVVTRCLATPKPHVNQCRQCVNKSQRISYQCICSKHSFYDNDGHYNDVIMSAMVSQITGVSIVCSTVCSGADQRKYQSSTSLVFVRGIHRIPNGHVAMTFHLWI